MHIYPKTELVYSQDFVDNLAVVGRSRHSARVCWCTSSGIDAPLNYINPRISEAGSEEEVDTSGSVGIPVVGVSADNDGPVTVLHVRQDLLDTGAPGVTVTCIRPKFRRYCQAFLVPYMYIYIWG